MSNKMFLTQLWRPFQLSQRFFATKIKKSVLLQDPEKIQEFKYAVSSESDRRVYVWGLAETGALGIQRTQKKHSQKHTTVVKHPSRLQFAETLNILDVTCGYGFSAFAVKRTDDYSLFGTGINTDSQIGFHKHGGQTNKPFELLIYPAPIKLPKNSEEQKIQIVKCAAGRAHLLALSEDGVVYGLGNNSYGQCGRPIIEDEAYLGSEIIKRLDNFDGRRISGIWCGQDHSLFLSECGKVFSCGWSADGQTGQGHYKAVEIPTQIGGDLGTENIVKVAGTVDCVLSLNDNGEVFGWGNAEYGQLETINDNQQINSPQFLKMTKGLGKIVDIAAGGSSCLILNENGDVFVWGYGLLGLGPLVEQKEHPTQIPPALFGRNEFSPNTRVTGIYCGINHMAAVNDQNDLYMWGRNRFGCLGLGHQNDQFFPFKISIGAKVMKVSCGVDHTIAVCKAFI